MRDFAVVDRSIRCWRPGLRIFVALAALGIVASPAEANEPPRSQAALHDAFEREVRPLLIEKCLPCHGPDKAKGGLRLDSRASILKGGDSGPAAVAGKPEESLLVEVLGDDGPVQMPPKTRLDPSQAARLTRWVAEGLPWPGDQPMPTPGGREGGIDIAARKAAHWAWQPLTSLAPPSIERASWPLHPIDRFVLARLESRKLVPAGEADRRVLIRRLSFDLTGLPPTPAEVHDFLGDRRVDAYERLVDRLLASPRFGERWGRHWLDLVRYAETRGHEFDPDIPNAWRYRDYVIRALNQDVPYSQFVLEHLAGDLLETPRIDRAQGTNESILGTSFWFLGEEVHSPVDLKQDEADRLDNRLDVMTKTFLGLTVACARCHDHKFDAISQRDYYALIGFLHSSSYRQARLVDPATEAAAARDLARIRGEARGRILRLAASAVRAELACLDAVESGRSSTTERNEAVQTLWRSELEKAGKEPGHAWHSLINVSGGRRAGGAQQETPENASTVVVDFGRLSSLDRWQDGRAFGERPLRPGDIEFQDDRLGVVTRASAVRDAGWPLLRSRPDDQSDHGRLGGFQRSGQMLRTPEFTLKSGRLWYRARGAGRAYASVQSHLVVAGPLHGAVMTEWTDGGKGWRWVHHDLAAYKGHRLHVELSPAAAGVLAISQVVDSEAEPTWIADDRRPSQGGRAAASTDWRAAMAGLREIVERMEADSIVDASDVDQVAPIVDGILRILSQPCARPTNERAAYQAEVGRILKHVSDVRASIAVTAPTAPALLDGNGVDSPLLIRGSARNPSGVVPRRFLEALDGPGPIRGSDEGSSRLDLAARILSPGNPFVPRVAVNRVWHHLLGRGLVASVDNFGVLGEPPTHPELLDYLATQFINEGWSIKKLVRSVVLSRTYRMSSTPDPSTDAEDPDNKLLHRRTVKRLEAEPIRDAILAVSGRLDSRLGGRSVPVHLTPFMQGRGRPGSSGPLDGDGRRSIYLAVRRNFLSPMMLAFDTPIPFSTVGRRNVSNVPAQALILMNDPFVAGEAARWGSRIVGTAGSPEDRLTGLFEAAFSRSPTEAERSEALDFLRGTAREWQTTLDDPRPWADLAHVLFNAKEFVFLE